MRPDLHSRYKRDEADNRIIDIAADRVEDLYEGFDKSAPYVHRDRDEELVDDLIASARELSRVRIAIRFTWAVLPEDAKLARIRHSLGAHFRYLTGKERLRIRAVLRRAAIFFTIGVAILSASIWINRTLGPDPRYWATCSAKE